MSYSGGWKATGELTISGPDALAKARLCSEIVWERLASDGFEYSAEERLVEFVGANVCHEGIPVPGADEPSEVVLRLGVKGPDFPTGGVLVGRRGIGEAYATGRGKVYLRGVCHVEDLNKDRQQLVIDEIPYNLSQRNLVEKIVEAVQDERIKDISDIRNESGRQAQTRVVIELKRGADPAVVENQLYQFTPLQSTE